MKNPARIFGKKNIFHYKENMNKKEPLHINYYYFGIFFVLSITFSLFTIFQIEEKASYSRLFFIIYSLGQMGLEVMGFVMITHLLQKYFKKIFLYIFIGFTFIFFISHLIDFILFKIMDMTFWEGLGIALDEDLENFIEMLHSTGIAFYLWIILGLLATSLPFIGIYIYKLTDKLSLKKKLIFSHDYYMQAFLCIPLVLLIWDFNASSNIDPSTYSSYQRAVPWKLTFVQPKTPVIDSPIVLKKPMSEDEYLEIIKSKDLSTNKKPNIYLFIIESLREDFITDEISPNISNFKKDNISFELSLANANATHPSWFSMFYSQHSFLWKYFKDSKWKSGSPALNILKKLGYSIHVYSAPELKYYSMIQILFGKDTNLLDSFHLYPHYHPVEACDADKQAMDAMTNDLNNDKPNIYIVFLDSTHFLYSFPKDKDLKFTPISEEIGYLNTFPSKEDIELIKNRYRNSIYFVDSLFSDFTKTLKDKNLYDDSIIVITGDHGEEFFEQGHLFHASHLSAVQTNVPIYLKLGNNAREVSNNKKIVCHMDIFPSIFDYIFEKDQFKDIFAGQSIFDDKPWPFVITSRYNASRAPFEFFIHSLDEKITLRFKNKKDIFKEQHLEIISIKNKDDKKIEKKTKDQIILPFEKAFRKIFYK